MNNTNVPHPSASPTISLEILNTIHHTMSIAAHATKTEYAANALVVASRPSLPPSLLASRCRPVHGSEKRTDSNANREKGRTPFMVSQKPNLPTASRTTEAITSIKITNQTNEIARNSFAIHWPRRAFAGVMNSCFVAEDSGGTAASSGRQRGVMRRGCSARIP